MSTLDADRYILTLVIADTFILVVLNTIHLTTMSHCTAMFLEIMCQQSVKPEN